MTKTHWNCSKMAQNAKRGCRHEDKVRKFAVFLLLIFTPKD